MDEIDLCEVWEMPVVSVAAVLEYLGDRTEWVSGDFPSDEVLEDVGPVDPGTPHHLSFFKKEDDLAREQVPSSLSRVVLVRHTLEGMAAPDHQVLVAVEDPRREFVRVTRDLFHPDPPRKGIHPAAVVDEGVVVGEDCEIGPGAYLETGVQIGDRCLIGANAVILSGTTIGDDVMVGPNASIGESGFGYVREDDGEPILVPHLGGVDIESDVTIGANTTVNRGSLNNTVIRRFAKIHNLVHIAHNSDIGEGAFVTATVNVNGSVRIGPLAWVSPNATIREHATIGKEAVVGMASTVLKDVPDGCTVFGMPARTVAKPSESG